MTTRRGLDGRDRDRNGKIRLKNGASKVKNLVKEIPDFKVFSHEATLTGLRKHYGVRSESELKKIAAIKLKAKKFGGN